MAFEKLYMSLIAASLGLVVSGCSGSEPEPDLSIRAAEVPAALTQFELEAEYDFTQEAQTEGVVSGGWSSVREWGRWTQGQNAELNFAFSDSSERVVQVASGALVGDAKPNMTVDVLVNGNQAAVWEYAFPETRTTDPNRPTYREVTINSEMYGDGNAVTIGLKVRDPRSPSDFNPDSHKVELGLSVFRVKVLKEAS